MVAFAACCLLDQLAVTRWGQVALEEHVSGLVRTNGEEADSFRPVLSSGPVMVWRTGVDLIKAAF